MTKKPNRIPRNIVLTLSAIGLVVALLWGYAQANSQHAYLDVEGTDSPVAIYPFERSVLDVGNGVKFSYNTGSFISTILPSDLQRLKAIGMEVDSVSFPSFGVDHMLKSFFTSKMYTVDLPVYDNKPGRKPENRRVVGRMKNVLFLPAPPTDSLSTIGVDVIERFVCLYYPEKGAVGFSTFVPGGFELLTDINSKSTLATLLGCGKRYYVDMSVENIPREFFINTSFPRVNIALPAEDTVMASSPLRASLAVTMRGCFRAKFLDKAWVHLGDRAGNHHVFFANTGFPERYIINPMNFFWQDAVIDYPNKRILLQPRSKSMPENYLNGDIIGL